ncbi:TetR/AcrR family transcriptional regulator [Nocardia sp. 2YAB30]|uniref:TetR/AcrR family transcriptional regulator n=1 Tax=unclassified Nocardia TaxID=2637762 RepID=UPI003F98E8A0
MSDPKSARPGRPASVDHARVLTAAYDLLREKGIVRPTTKAIAERAEVMQGSIFYRYKDRAGLLMAVYTRALEPLAAGSTRLIHAPHSPAWDIGWPLA